jgi:hypothetical protein
VAKLKVGESSPKDAIAFERSAKNFDRCSLTDFVVSVCMVIRMLSLPNTTVKATSRAAKTLIAIGTILSKVGRSDGP